MEPKNFENLIGTRGFSDILLRNHFSLYNGYVTNTLKLLETLKDKGSIEFAELTRRFGWEFNGMRLHELYFGNMSSQSKEIDKTTPIYSKISQDFGSFENFEKQFKSIGAMRGIGWAILTYDKETKRLFNTWINEHNTGHLATAVPLLVMDVFEHSFITDYGLKKTDYIENFFKVINWEVVSERFESV
ncbi:MAG: Fe-Mn family superoxide dismutase [archaeon]